MNQDKNTTGTSSDSFSKDRSLQSEAAAGKGKLAELADSAATAGKAQLDSSLGEAAGQVEQVAKVIDETAERLRKESHEGLAAYASQVAGSIESVANRLRNSSVDELATEARQLARSNPTMFLLGSVAVGFGLTRFLKASSRMSHDGGQLRHDVYGSTYGDSRDPTHDWESGTAGRLQGGSSFDSGSAGGFNGGAGSSGGMGGSSSGGSSSSGLGGSSSGGSSSSGMGGSTSGGSASSGTGSSSNDSLNQLRDKPMFPEMNPAGLTPGGTVGGSRTDKISGGSNG